MLGWIDQSGKRLKAGRGVNGGDHSLCPPVGASLGTPLHPNKSGDFLHADSGRFGLNLPISVGLSKQDSKVQLYTFPGVEGNPTGAIELNIPMKPEAFSDTFFRIFLRGSGGWFAAPGRSLCGCDFWRVFSSYAAGWARIILLPREADLRGAFIVKIRVLALKGIENGQTSAAIDLRNYEQVIDFYGFG